jgi:hypothetical protein
MIFIGSRLPVSSLYSSNISLIIQSDSIISSGFPFHIDPAISDPTVSSPFLEMDDLFLYLNYPGLEPIEVHTSLYSTVHSLEPFLPDSRPHAFFLRDFELSPTFTFGYYGIQNYCAITAIPTASEDPPPDFHRKVSCPTPSVSDTLTDQFIQHVEGTTSSYRKLVNKFLRVGSPRPKKRPQRPTVIPGASEQPATDALPRPW